MAVITKREATDFPKEHEALSAKLIRLQNGCQGTVKPALSVMFAASAMVLLIASANLREPDARARASPAPRARDALGAPARADGACCGI
jgi:hypothetical protein